MQERGVKPARALPYELDAHAHVNATDGSVRIDFLNTGDAAVVFHVRSGNNAQTPRSYTVESGKQLSDGWDVAAIGAAAYDLSVYGPNGFFRSFAGGVASSRARLDVAVAYDANSLGVTLTISNPGSNDASVQVLDQYSGRNTADRIDGHSSVSHRWSVAPTSGWYSLVVTSGEDAGFVYKLAGHVENGRDSMTDPAMGGVAISG